jgi:hypothetical protein
VDGLADGVQRVVVVEAGRPDADDRAPLALAGAHAERVPRRDGLEPNLVNDGEGGIEALEAVRVIADREHLALVEGHGDAGGADAREDERAAQQLGLGLDHRHRDAVAGPDRLPDRGRDDRNLRRTGAVVVEQRPDGQRPAQRGLPVTARGGEDAHIVAVGECGPEKRLLERREVQRLAVSGAF